MCNKYFTSSQEIYIYIYMCVCVCVFVCVIYMYNYGVYKLINTGQCYSWTILRPGSRSLCSSLVVIVV